MRSKNEVLSQIAYWCFYAAVIIEACMVIIDKSNYTNPIEGRLFQLTFLLFLLKVCLTKYTWKEYFCIFLFCILGAISYFVTGRNEIVRLVIFVAACKEVDIRKCMKLVFWITLSGCLVIIGLSVTGIYGGLSLTQDYGRGMVETRYTLGMGHPNALQCMVWSMTVLGMYLYGVRMKWWHYLMILALNIFFFWLTDSRTSLLVTIYAIILVFIVIRSPNAWREKVISWIGIITSVGSIGISILTAAGAYRVYDYIWYDDRSPITLAFYYLNKILNGRIRTLVGTTRFEGTVQTWHLFSGPENNYFFDMGWIRLFYWYGIIPGCVFVAAIAVLLIYFYKKNDFMSIVLIASICLYTITEAHVISVYLARNYIFFLIGAVWYEVIKGPASRKNENIWERENSIGRIN